MSKCEGCGKLGVYFGQLCTNCLRKAHDEYLKNKRILVSRERVYNVVFAALAGKDASWVSKTVVDIIFKHFQVVETQKKEEKRKQYGNVHKH